MKEEELLQVLSVIGEKLRNKFGIEPGIFHEGYIILEKVGTPTAPIIPEEISQLIQQALKERKIPYNFTEWPIVVNSKNGNLVIRYIPT